MPSTADAVKALISYLHRLDGTKAEVNVYHYIDRGFRISEVSFFLRSPTGGSGSSYMRSNPKAGAFILACEDFILTFGLKPHRPPGWSSDIDEHADAKDCLKYLWEQK